MTYTAWDGTEFENVEEFKKYEFETRYTIRGRHGEPDDPIHEVRDPGEISGQPFDVSDLNNCVVVLLDHTDQIQIENVHNSRIFIGACRSLVMVRNCSNCTFTLATRQFLARDVSDCCFFLYCLTDPVLEHCTSLEFGPFNGAYPQHAAHLAAAGLDPSSDHWWRIHDASATAPVPSKGPSTPAPPTAPAFRLITLDEWGNGASVEPWLPAGEEAEPAVPLTWPPQATWQAQWEAKLQAQAAAEEADLKAHKAQAQDELDAFYDRRTDLYAHRQARNRELETLFLDKLQAKEAQDNPYARVLALIGLGEGGREEQGGALEEKADKSRFRSLLFDLRERPPPNLSARRPSGGELGSKGGGAGMEVSLGSMGGSRQAVGGGGAGEDGLQDQS